MNSFEEQNEKKIGTSEEDARFMRAALSEAALAEAEDEVPVGAVIVHRGRIIASAHNTREGDKCATSHAELRAIEEACRVLGGWRLPDSTLYVTLEPCPMCAGAILHARLDRVVFGTYDPKGGAFGSLIDLNELPLNHKTVLTPGVLCEECASVLTDYFRKKRELKKRAKTPSSEGE